MEGVANDLLERIRKDELFSAIHDNIDNLVKPIDFVGRAPEQVDEFVVDHILPLMTKYKDDLNIASTDGVHV